MSTYYANVDIISSYGSYTDINDAITALLGSGLVSTDSAIINITAGTYADVILDNPSGSFILNASDETYIPRFDSINSGLLVINNIDIEELYVTGSGIFTYNDSSFVSGFIYDCPSTYLDNVDINELIVNDSKLNVIGCDCSGVNSNITASGLSYFNIISGCYSTTGDIDYKIQLKNSYNFNMEYTYGLNYDTPDTEVPFTFVDVSGFAFNHCSFVSTSGGILNCTSSSGEIIYSIFASSGTVNPVSGVSSIYIYSSGSYLTNYSNIGATYADISGEYGSLDPRFTNIASGDLRINANSPCACAAEYIDSINNLSGNITNTMVDQNAIQFYVQDEGYKAVPPSSIYVVQGGKAIYFGSDETYNNDMDVIVNKQYTINAEIQTIESLSNDKTFSKHPYPLDYEVDERLNYSTHELEKYATPYTIVPLNNILSSENDEINNVSVSGIYSSRGFSREHVALTDDVPFYWVGEKNNGYIYRYSTVDNELLGTYVLFNELNPSGVESVEINNELYKFTSFKVDRNAEIRAMVDYRDWIYILTKHTLSEDDDEISFSNDMYIYNKFDDDLFKQPVSIISGILNIAGDNPTDITLDDIGNLYISSSGQITKYAQLYDYGLVTSAIGSINSNVTFREKYEGVDL